MSEIANDLNLLLADYQVHYQKLRNYHWNVRGPMFFELHLKFEELYTGANVKVDDIAERVLALGVRPLSTLKEQLGAATLQEDATVPDAPTMVKNTLADLEVLNGRLRSLVQQSADAGDVGTANLLEPMADEQEKTAWMLKAFLA
jgi:starvation-inducible DNA-binding protein